MARKLPGGDFGQESQPIFAETQGLAFRLPDAGRWAVVSRASAGLLARHAPTGSLLWMRTWRENRPIRVADCGRRVKVWNPAIREPGPGELVERASVVIEPDYRGTVQVAVWPASEENGVAGQATLYAADGRGCIGMAFSTEAPPPEAARVVALRLGQIRATVIDHLRRREVEQRISPVRR